MAVNEIGHIKLWSNSRLPAEYQEVEYIQSSGNAYINSGYSPNSSPYFQVKFKGQQVSNIQNNDYFYSAGGTSNNWSSFENSNGFYWNAGGTTGILQHQVTIGTDFEYDVKYNNGTFIASGTVSGTTTYNVGSGLGTGTFCFFGAPANSRYMNAKVYYFKMYSGQNFNLIRDFVPCYRKSDNVIGMYDLVNNTFYTNAGSGTFTKGNNIDTPGYIDAGHAYIGQTLVRPHIRSCEFSYDFRNGSLAGFQAAGGCNIESRGGYGIDSGGVYISGSGYDNWFTARVPLPDLSNAKHLTIDSCAYYIAGSWSNNKRAGMSDRNDWCNGNNNRLYGELAFNTASPGTYNEYGIWGFGGALTYERVNGGTGEYQSILDIDLQTGCTKWCTCGPTNKLYQYTLNSGQINCIKGWTRALYEKEEGYCYRGERLRCIHYCVDY